MKPANLPPKVIRFSEWLRTILLQERTVILYQIAPENACEKMNYLLKKLMSLKWLSADQCDEALRELKKLVDDIRK